MNPKNALIAALLFSMFASQAMAIPKDSIVHYRFDSCWIYKVTHSEMLPIYQPTNRSLKKHLAAFIKAEQSEDYYDSTVVFAIRASLQLHEDNLELNITSGNRVKDHIYAQPYAERDAVFVEYGGHLFLMNWRSESDTVKTQLKENQMFSVLRKTTRQKEIFYYERIISPSCYDRFPPNKAYIIDEYFQSHRRIRFYAANSHFMLLNESKLMDFREKNEVEYYFQSYLW